MSKLILTEIEENRRRLNYYTGLKTKGATAKSPVLKWIEIYTERVQKLERQASRAGLKTELQALRAKSAESVARV